MLRGKVPYWMKNRRERECRRRKNRKKDGEEVEEERKEERYQYNFHHSIITKNFIAKHPVRSHARWSEIYSPDGKYILVNPYG